MDTLKKKNNLFIPFIVAVIGSALMLLTIFLPYTSATKEFAERIDSYPEAVAYSNTDIKASDVKMFLWFSMLVCTAVTVKRFYINHLLVQSMW